MISISRFQVWLIGLNPAKGKEINKTRPCVVISPDEMAALSTIVVAPMTTKGLDFPCRIKCQFKNKNWLILLDKMRAVDKSRFIKKLGSIGESTQIELWNTLQEMFAY